MSQKEMQGKTGPSPGMSNSKFASGKINMKQFITKAPKQDFVKANKAKTKVNLPSGGTSTPAINPTNTSKNKYLDGSVT